METGSVPKMSSGVRKWAKVVGVTACMLSFAGLTCGAVYIFVQEALYGEGWLPVLLTGAMGWLGCIATYGCADELVRTLKGTDHARSGDN